MITHIESVARRRAVDADRLVASLRGGSSQGGGRTEPGAREWVRRWGPARYAATTPACSCARGACLVCN